MDRVMSESEPIRQQALWRVREGDYAAAIELYDRALRFASDGELRELIEINKAHALIFARRDGPEVAALPSVLMRRQSPHNVFLAAYALLLKHRLNEDLRRAVFYGELAVDLGRKHEHAICTVSALNELGILYETDSHFDKAIACHVEALAYSDAIEDRTERTLLRTAITANLGYNRIIVGNTAEGLSLIESVLDDILLRSDRSDAHIELCFGYLDVDELDRAKRHGETGLELAVEPRQIRNAHYLLGETAHRTGDTALADHHFEKLAQFYPHFRNLKDLLFAVDLRRVMNLMS